MTKVTLNDLLEQTHNIKMSMPETLKVKDHQLESDKCIKKIRILEEMIVQYSQESYQR